MVPGRSERDNDFPIRLQQSRHFFQDLIRVTEVFERINREDNIRLRIEVLHESTIGNTDCCLPRPRDHQVLFLNIQADYMFGAMPGHFYRFLPLAASEIEHHLASYLLPDCWTKENLQLVLTFVTRWSFDVMPFVPVQN